MEKVLANIALSANSSHRRGEVAVSEVPSKKPLGSILTADKFISQRQLKHALSTQERDGSRLGDILISQGSIGYYNLYHAVAQSYRLPFVNLLETPRQDELLDANDVSAYLQLCVMPWRREQDFTWIAVCDVTDETLSWVQERFGINTNLVITSPLDIKRTVERQFGTSIEKESCLSLRTSSPDASAYKTLTLHQKNTFCMLVMLASAFSINSPAIFILACILLCHVSYGITMIFKTIVFVAGSRPITSAPTSAIGNHDLPLYTVLIPMYKEAASLPGMLQSMQKMDYPASKLDIKLVLEADDEETLAAAYALKPRYQFDIIRVPPGKPRTKPKACNYGLRFARGEFITVFDADDRPEPLQLKKVVQAFRTLPEDVVCLQARLSYYNANDNILTRFFALEYSMLFHVLLAGLERLGIPIPLGGTSNHIALDRLKALGEWDPYNVTEDADLGTRLAAHGLKTAMIDSYTMEEATNSREAWIKQRSRWIKGYMQTWLVHMRHPVQLWETLGWKGFVGFQCFVGLSTFTFLTAPLLWVMAILWWSGLTFLDRVHFPHWLAWVTLGNLAINVVSHWYYAGLCYWRYHARHWLMTFAAFTFPLYLILHSIASYKALWQLIFRPHFWEKTTHGLARSKFSFTRP